MKPIYTLNHDRYRAGRIIGILFVCLLWLLFIGVTGRWELVDDEKTFNARAILMSGSQDCHTDSECEGVEEK